DGGGEGLDPDESGKDRLVANRVCEDESGALVDLVGEKFPGACFDALPYFSRLGRGTKFLRVDLAGLRRDAHRRGHVPDFPAIAQCGPRERATNFVAL